MAVVAASYGLFGSTVDEVDGVALYDPFTPVTNSGAAPEIKPGKSATPATSVRTSELGAQTHAGWLVVTQDDRSGLAEADRVALTGVDASPAAAVKRSLRVDRW